MSVQITVLFFAKAKEITGKPKAPLTVPNLIRCDHLLNAIVEEFSLEPIKDNVIIAHREEFCELTSEVHLNEGDEVAVVPPLSGG